MSKYISRAFLIPFIIFVFLDFIAIGAGMGVPFFAILLGFLVGWFLPTLFSDTAPNLQYLLRLSLVGAFVTSGFTFILMFILWGPTVSMLFNPSTDLANFGIPMILFEPKASFIGWLVLMIFIAPFLQALTAIFTSAMRIAWRPPLLTASSSIPAQ